MSKVFRATATFACAVLVLGVSAPAASAQSVLDRPPNISNGWVGSSGTLYFHFLHRFTASPAPERKVSNVPTFLMGVGLPSRTLIGALYATNSQLAPRYPNEWEFFARHAVFSQEGGAPADLVGHVGYNLAAEGLDGEASLARQQGPLRLVATGRVLSDPYERGQTRFAAGGGATLRVGRYLALAGDVTSLMNRTEEERIAWSGGLHLALPTTPHTLSLHVTNTNAATLQGMSRGGEQLRYGFEFTIPVHLSRFFPSSPAPAVAPPTAPPAAPAGEHGAAASAGAATGAVVSASMKNFAFAPAQIEIAAGTTLEWTNDDQVAHTVTAGDGSFDSGMLAPGAKWSHTFGTPGSYPFFCTPHPFMKGTVVVR